MIEGVRSNLMVGLQIETSRTKRNYYSRIMLPGVGTLTPRLVFPLPEGQALFGSSNEVREYADRNSGLGVVIPRGFESFIIDYRLLEVLGFKTLRAVPDMMQRVDYDGYLQSLHRVDLRGRETLLNAGLTSSNFDGIEVAVDGDRRLLLATAIIADDPMRNFK